MSEEVKLNDDSLVIYRKVCGHAGPITALPTDGQKHVRWRFLYKCAACGIDEETQLSDIQSNRDRYKH